MIKFHHTGLVVSNLNDFESKLFYQEKVTQAYDSLQDANLILYKNYGDSFIELIEPLSPKAYTWNYLYRGSNPPYHHFCYEVSNEAELNHIKTKHRLLPIVGPIPAVLFDNKLVAFFYTRNKMIVEFLIQGDESFSDI